MEDGMVKVILPDLGEGITKATVSYWFYKQGEKVTQNDDLIELVTDKATFNLPSPCTGMVSQIIRSEGDTVNSGDLLAIIEESQ
jgi:pyruvate/2-oxoglutarate dehydrogenase complex dihydrolipoamide acyltransferase (E2) component